MTGSMCYRFHIFYSKNVGFQESEKKEMDVTFSIKMRVGKRDYLGKNWEECMILLS